MSDTSVHSLLLGQQEELLVKLRNDRKLLKHPTDQGDASELDWHSVIEDFLPDRYKVARATILDCNGNTSDVIDLVIFDRQYCPLWFKRGSAQYIPAESVYAIFETKQTLNAAHVKYAGEKALSVRKLHRTNAPIVHAGGEEKKPKKPFRILAGILTLESDWTPPLGPSFDSTIKRLRSNRQIDIGCALEHGSFDIVRRPNKAILIVRSEQDAALMFFLMRLFNRLQRMGTVPAIELDRYARSLEN
jgi:hypothetical protein